MPSTAFAITFAANNIKKMLKDNKRKKIVLLQDQMNSAVYPWQYLVDDCNNSVELGIIPYPQKDETWTSAVIDRIDDTILVAMSTSFALVRWNIARLSQNRRGV